MHLLSTLAMLFMLSVVRLTKVRTTRLQASLMRIPTGPKPASYPLVDTLMQRSMMGLTCSLSVVVTRTSKPKSVHSPVPGSPVLNKVLHFIDMKHMLNYSWCLRISVKVFPNCLKKNKVVLVIKSVSVRSDLVYMKKIKRKL